MKSTREKGKIAEDIACEYLLRKGCEIVARNFYTRFGEIDIVCKEDDQLVFCEVKAKFHEYQGLPEEEFHQEKYERFQSAIFSYLLSHSINDDTYRIDLLAMQLDERKKECTVRHYRNYY
ncbi:YraN family protein [Candidatus Falkowbacteria bacterium]|nr:YraN family protein [Candidatus Falkowbacteria bacterium]